MWFEFGTNGIIGIIRTAKFVNNGFPLLVIREVLGAVAKDWELRKRALPAPPDPDAVRPIRLSVPYLGAPFHALQRQARRIGISLVAKTASTIGGYLCAKQKHRLPKEQERELVYAIRCGCGHLYVGETERELAVRAKEHESGCRTKDRKSAFGGHNACNPAVDIPKGQPTNLINPFNPENVRIVAKEGNSRLRLLAESALIRTVAEKETIIVSPNDAALNRNAGTLMDERWLPILRREADRAAAGQRRSGDQEGRR